MISCRRLALGLVVAAGGCGPPAPGPLADGEGAVEALPLPVGESPSDTGALADAGVVAVTQPSPDDVASPFPSAVLVDGGRPLARVIVRENAPPVTRFAAGELIRIVAAASAVRLPLIVLPVDAPPPEGEGIRIWVGDHPRLRELGFDPDSLPPEAYWLALRGHDLVLAGNEGVRGWEGEDTGPPLFPRAALHLHHDFFGTFFAVHRLLRGATGVTWLWPGPGGEVVPEVDRVVAVGREGVQAPALSFRTFGRARTYRWSVLGEPVPPRMRELGFTPGTRLAYGSALELFLKRHGMGGERLRPGPGHRFQGWREEYGATRPDWFLLPGREGWAAGLCPPAPGLVDHVSALGADWRGVLDVSEVDGPILGHGPGCDAWDPPGTARPPEHPPEVASYYGPPWVSDRYARFWARIVDRLEEQSSPGTVATLLYMNYLPAPLEPPVLGSRVYGEFVPFGGGDGDFFPMSDRTLEWLVEQWEGWATTGMRLAYRPNHLHDGYTLPWMAPRQFARLFRALTQRGMEGAYYDSLTGQWGTQGPLLYLHLRLLDEPDRSPEEILDDFFDGFGPAAEAVSDYFDFWERFTEESRERVNTTDFGGNRWDRFQVAAHRVVPGDVHREAGALLALAEKAAYGDAAAERVAFLRLGWVHAGLTLALARAMDPAGTSGTGTDARTRPPDGDVAGAAAGDPERELACLITFRRDAEHLFVADFDAMADRETRHWSFSSSPSSPTFSAADADPRRWWRRDDHPSRAPVRSCLDLLE